MKVHPLARTSLVFAIVAACGGKSAEPAEPVERPPLPPLSTSPIALLVEHELELDLTTAQLVQLSQIDKDLAASNRPLEAELGQIDRARPPRPGGGGPPMGGGRRGGMGGPPMGGGGMGGGGMGGGGRMGGMGGGPPGGGRSGGPRSGSGSQDDGALRDRLRAQHAQTRGIRSKLAANTETALAVAVCALRTEQRTRARSILDADGYTLPTLPCETPTELPEPITPDRGSP